MRGLVDRQAFEKHTQKFFVGPRDTSRIHLLFSDLADAPRPGEGFTDSLGYRHRVQKSKRCDYYCQIDCEVSVDLAAGIGDEAGQAGIAEEGGAGILVEVPQ